MIQSAQPQSSFIRYFLLQLSDRIAYAVERNIELIEEPLVSDIDIILQKKDFCCLLQQAKDSGLLISVAISYGGARLFIGEGPELVKRVDCMWNIHYRGIPLDNVQQLLDERIRDSEKGFYVLPATAQARVAWAIKNAYGGAEEYRALLENYGYAVLDGRNRLHWLMSAAFKHPLATMIGSTGTLLAYMIRFIRPTGLLVSGISVERLRESRVIRYLFQNRIHEETPAIISIFRARVLSEICITPHRWLAELDLSHYTSLSHCEKAVIQFLRSKRVPHAHR